MQPDGLGICDTKGSISVSIQNSIKSDRNKSAAILADITQKTNKQTKKKNNISPDLNSQVQNHSLCRSFSNSLTL